ncbi:H-NS histone family protein [uncultured Roseobacter sp.]|uniref:H-NS histone family protein n=1 Tax=uncultured Roseobacter sp. TaxID=114847 RepID=UPI00261B1939|nr:H-NS histone family protein [uncultured Roseobacter sp.]
MAKINLEKMSIEELRAHERDVANAIAQAEKRTRADAVKAMKDAAAKFGYSVEELMDGKSPAKGAAKKNSTPPKYQHPENPAVTWTGRGRKPAWINDGLKAGKSLDDFLIR